MNYDQTIAYLYNSQPAFHQVGAAAYKPGLDNTIRLMEQLHNPHTMFRSIHVAGTNGKGSTSHLLAAVLQKAGYKVGLYTSPHLVDFRERIRINGNMIPKERVVDFVDKQQRILENIRPSFFETTMALAFDYFASEKVDIAVIEVGLGGRLDSTNIITPELSIITNIGIDHTEFLGHTLPEIAAEKAGIIKPNIPVIIGETHPQTASVFIQKAKEVQAEIIFADNNYQLSTALPIVRTVNCQLSGCYQTKNQRTVLAAIAQLKQKGWNISEEAIQQGFANVCTLTGLRGRWETLAENPLVICDTGHNAHGIKYVVQQLKTLSGTLHIVFGMVDDKDVEDVLKMLPKQAHYYFTQAQTKRAIPATELKKMAEKKGLQGQDYTTMKDAIQAAKEIATTADTIFIGGSNYIVGEAICIFEK